MCRRTVWLLLLLLLLLLNRNRLSDDWCGPPLPFASDLCVAFASPPPPAASWVGLWITWPPNGSQHFVTLAAADLPASVAFRCPSIIPSVSPSPSPSEPPFVPPEGDFFDVPIGPRSGEALVAMNGAELYSFSSLPPLR
uniref:Secreted protein n=1 Tax=Anopheles farauti TaxID=69004 RepID=A0A182Q133_9DIPT